MPFGLTIGTERANSLQVRARPPFSCLFQLTCPFFSQNAIQHELMKRGFSPDAGQSNRTTFMHFKTYSGRCTDPVMAEYITIMIINNKTAGTSTTSATLLGWMTDTACHTAQITSELEDRKYHTLFRCFHPQLTTHRLLQ